MSIGFHVWALSPRETITFIRRFIQAKSTQEQKQTKARRKLPAEVSWPSSGKENNIRIDILEVIGDLLKSSFSIVVSL